MQTHVGPPFRCDAARAESWLERCSSLPTCIHALALHASTAPFPVAVDRVTGVLQGSPGEHKDHTHPAGATEGGWWLKQVVRSRKSGGSDGAVSKKRKQYDVCNREWCPGVPTCTAAQLGLHVLARHSEQHFWCVQSRHFTSGHEHLQAQRSWSERQLSQQLLPSEEWGRIHVVFRRLSY